MTDWIIQRGWPLLAGLAWKSLGLAVVSGIVAVARSRASAAARHLVWRLCVVGLLLLPALSVLLPGWAVPVPARPVDAPVLVATPAPPAPAPAISLVVPRPAEASARPVSAPEAALATEASVPARPATPWQVWAFGVWAVGGALVLLPTLLGLLAVRRLERRCRPVAAGPLSDALAALTSRPVRLMTAPADGPDVPMTWGGRRPALLLPPDAGGWPPDRLRATLLHELAHMERADWLAQMAAQAACALYWFNPLVWLAARRMAQEAERACDDRVLGAGVVPADYAGHLLDTVRGLQEKPLPAVLPMGQASTLEGRLKAILQPRRRQTMLTKPMLWLGGGVALLVLLPLAAIRPHSVQTPPDGASASTSPALAWQAPLPMGTTTAPPSQEVTLPNGIQVKLLGFAQNPSRNVPWSTPDGRAGIKSPYLSANETNNNLLERSVEFAVYLDGLRRTRPGAVSFAAMAAPSELGGGASCNITTYVRWGNSFPPRNLQAVVATFPKTGNEFQTGAFLFGVADGLWQTAAAKQFTGSNATSSTQNTDAAILISASRGLSRPLIVSVANDVAPSVETRIVAVDRRGALHTPEEMDGGGSETTSFRGAPSLDEAIRSYHDIYQSLVTFPSLPLRDVREVRFQTRPYQWVLFKNLALYPILTPTTPAGKP